LKKKIRRERRATKQYGYWSKRYPRFLRYVAE